MIKNRFFLFSLILVLIFTQFYIFSENVYLKDGRSFKGKLIGISKKKISINESNKIKVFDIDLIDYLISPVSQNEIPIIVFKNNKGYQQKVNLLKLTNSVLYYKNINENELRFTSLSLIQDLSLFKQNDNNVNNVNILKINHDESTDLSIDFENLIQTLSKINTITSNIIKNESNSNIIKTDLIDLESADFYEKFWAKINKYVDINTENLMWNLLEDYSDKEKSLNLIYNEGLIVTNKKSEDSNIKIKIKNLRKDFYKRAKKILLSNKI